ncbi:MAG: ice-binding family protein [Burkholderiales bacterium]
MRVSTIWFLTLLLAAFAAGCGSSNKGPEPVADTTAPTVSSTNPGHTTTGIAVNRSLAATFSEPMDSATCTTTTFTLAQGVTPVGGAVTCVGRTATFNPTSDLAASTLYTATITTGVKDAAGNALAANKTWDFTTGTTSDAAAPTVSSTDPADAATGVVVNGNITATFSEAIDPATCTATTFALTQGVTSVPAAVTCVGSTATLNPTSNLAASTSYTATITSGVMDLAGLALAAGLAPNPWTFTTSASAATAAGPAPVLLGTAAGFAILTKTGVTNVPASAITGDVGASPITGAAIGVPCANVTGTIYDVDAAYTGGGAADVTCRVTDATLLTTAVSDMELAYTDAAGRTLPNFTELGAGNISGLTLVPGLYKWGTGVSMDNTGVTLAGGANDVWIFQIAQDLTVANGAIVTLSGAQAKNVFWQVAGQATLGTTANFKGTILSQTLISLNTGAVLSGRALAQTQVTLDQNTVTRP